MHEVIIDTWLAVLASQWTLLKLHRLIHFEDTVVRGTTSYRVKEELWFDSQHTNRLGGQGGTNKHGYTVRAALHDYLPSVTQEQLIKTHSVHTARDYATTSTVPLCPIGCEIARILRHAASEYGG